jgi:hypothetical protein
MPSRPLAPATASGPGPGSGEHLPCEAAVRLFACGAGIADRRTFSELCSTVLPLVEGVTLRLLDAEPQHLVRNHENQ